MKCILIIYILFLHSSLFANSNTETRFEKITNLINKEESFIKTINNRGPRLEWRLLELETERLKLLRKKENTKFLSANSKLRSTHKKSWFFIKSKKYENEIQQKGLEIIKRWPNFKYNADIYYTLGLNSRDFNESKQTEYFFLKSLGKASKGAHIIYLVQVGLAEYYYNEKKYHKAILFYSKVIKNNQDEWQSKHLLNLSWCYLKIGQYNKAVDLAITSYEKTISKDKHYIDVKDQIYDSIGLFFVMAKREREGASFYQKYLNDSAKYIIKMSQKMANEGQYQKADYLLNITLNHAIKNKQTDEEITTRLAYLDFYRNFKKFNHFYNMSKTIEHIYINKPFNNEFLSQTIDKIENLVGYLQIRLTRNSKLKITNYDPQLLERVLSYFDILSNINKDNSDYYRFYQGETYFAVNQSTNAFVKYQHALEINKKINLKTEDNNHKHSELRTKLLNSLLACLEEKRFNNNDIIYTYKNHLDLYPVNPISRKLYSKLNFIFFLT